MKETYTIKDIALITGLSTRTIRNYIASGFLYGNKDEGVWTFSTEQLEAFLNDNAVKPAIRAKKNSIVYDFMRTKPEGKNKICVVLDLEIKEGVETTAFFCKNISDSNPDSELRFSSDPFGNGIRIIISGSTKDVMKMLTDYNSQK